MDTPARIEVTNREADEIGVMLCSMVCVSMLLTPQGLVFNAKIKGAQLYLQTMKVNNTHPHTVLDRIPKGGSSEAPTTNSKSSGDAASSAAQPTAMSKGDRKLKCRSTSLPEDAD